VTTIRFDPSRPAIALDAIRCPGCGQTLDVIVEGGPSLPTHHWREPTVPRDGRTRGRAVVRIDGDVGRHPLVCRLRADDLVRLVFIAQREAAP
jgi:hypothetical protein